MNNCKHLWKQASVERQVNDKNPILFDTLLITLYCPKCFETKSLPLVVGKEPTEDNLRRQAEFKANSIYTTIETITKEVAVDRETFVSGANLYIIHDEDSLVQYIRKYFESSDASFLAKFIANSFSPVKSSHDADGKIPDVVQKS